MVYNGKPYYNGWFGGTIIFGNIHKDFMLLIDIRDVEGFWVLITCAGDGQSGSIWLVDFKVGVYDPKQNHIGVTNAIPKWFPTSCHRDAGTLDIQHQRPCFKILTPVPRLFIGVLGVLKGHLGPRICHGPIVKLQVTHMGLRKHPYNSPRTFFHHTPGFPQMTPVFTTFEAFQNGSFSAPK